MAVSIKARAQGWSNCRTEMAPDQVIYFCWFGRSSRCASDYEVPDVEAQLCSLGQAHTLC